MSSSSSSCGSATRLPRDRITFTADDFGLSLAVNEAVERAHREGVLDAASLMVAGPAAADAVERARNMPRLRVGLHLVVIEGPTMLAPPWLRANISERLRADWKRAGIAPLVTPAQAGVQANGDGGAAHLDSRLRGNNGGRRLNVAIGQFDSTRGESALERHCPPAPTGQFSTPFRLALRYAFGSRARHRLAAEIEAQFAAFAATGLALRHADAHKHMHLHPVVGRLMVAIGRGFGLKRVRVPAEPPGVLAALGAAPRLADRALYAWSHTLRSQVRRAGLESDDHVFGLAWSGHMTVQRVRALLNRLPQGSSEIYFHPAAGPDPALAALMPGYEHEAELAALLDPAVREAAGRA